MYRNQDGDNGRPSVQAVPEAQPIDQTELTGLHQAEAEAAATPLPAAAVVSVNTKTGGLAENTKPLQTRSAAAH